MYPADAEARNPAGDHRMSDMADELRDLIDEYLGGEIEVARFARLQAWLIEDPQARAYFVRYAQVHSQLYIDMRAECAADRVMERIHEFSEANAPEASIIAEITDLQAEIGAADDSARSAIPADYAYTQPQPHGKSS